MSLTLRLAAHRALLLIDRRHPALVDGLLLEGVHAAAFSSERELNEKRRLLAAAGKPAARERERMSAALREHAAQHHAWSVRASWLAHVLASTLRGAHYDQERLVWGTN